MDLYVENPISNNYNNDDNNINNNDYDNENNKNIRASLNRGGKRRTGINFGTLSNNTRDSKVSFNEEAIINDIKRHTYNSSLASSITSERRVFTQRITADDSDEQDAKDRERIKMHQLIIAFIIYAILFIISYFSIQSTGHSKGHNQKFIYVGAVGGFVGTCTSSVMLYLFSTLKSAPKNPNETWFSFYANRILTVILFPINGSLNPPLALMYWRSFCDLLLGLRFLFVGTQFKQFENQSPYQYNCYSSSGFLEFAELSSEAWFFCQCLELLLSIRYPFTSFKSRMKYYHLGVWSTSILFASLVGAPYNNVDVEIIGGVEYQCKHATKNSLNCTKYDVYNNGFTVARLFNPGQQAVDDDSYTPEKNANEFYPDLSTSFCWVNGMIRGNSSMIDTFPWIFLYMPLIFILVFSFYSLYRAYLRFQIGISVTLLHRLNIMVLNFVNIFWYFCYWFVLFVLLICANSPSIYFGSEYKDPHKTKSDLGGNSFILSAIFYMISSKGFTGLVVWILVGDLERSLKSIDDDTLDISDAIRGETLAYITAGIRTTTEYNNINDQSKISFVLSSTLDIKNIKVFQGERYFFMKVILGHNSLIVHVKKQVQQAPTHEMISESLKQGQLTFGEAPTTAKKNLKSHRNSLNLIAKKLTKDVEEENSSIMVTECTSLEQSLLNRMKRYLSNEIPPPLFLEHVPNIFRKIRELSDIRPEAYKSSFKNLFGNLSSIGGGATGALFFQTEDENFVVKSCTEKDIKFLIMKGPLYLEYLQRQKETYISKIYGVYTLNMYNLQFHFIVMQNVTPRTVKEKYDVKGSWVDRQTYYPRDGSLALCKNCLEPFVFKKNKTKIFKEHAKARSVSGENRVNRITSEILSSIRTETRIKCSKTLKGIHEPLQTQKDLDIKYKLKLDPDEALQIYNQIKEDVRFLCDTMEVMDYSLLIGIEKEDHDVPKSESFLGASERGIPFKSLGLMQFRSFEANSMTSSHYYFGIVDYLGGWDLQKKLENFIKTKILQKDPDGISCVETKTYSTRFILHIADLLDIEEVDIDETKDDEAYV